jgi:hypothetical protein
MLSSSPRVIRGTAESPPAKAMTSSTRQERTLRAKAVLPVNMASRAGFQTQGPDRGVPLLLREHLLLLRGGPYTTRHGGCSRGGPWARCHDGGDESKEGRNIGDRGKPMQVVLTFENTEVLTKIRRRDGSTLTSSGRFHKPVSIDELKVEDKEGRS